MVDLDLSVVSESKLRDYLKMPITPNGPEPLYYCHLIKLMFTKGCPRPDGSPLHDEDVADVRLSVVSNQYHRDPVAFILDTFQDSIQLK